MNQESCLVCKAATQGNIFPLPCRKCFAHSACLRKEYEIQQALDSEKPLLAESRTCRCGKKFLPNSFGRALAGVLGDLWATTKEKNQEHWLRWVVGELYLTLLGRDSAFCSNIKNHFQPTLSIPAEHWPALRKRATECDDELLDIVEASSFEKSSWTEPGSSAGKPKAKRRSSKQDPEWNKKQEKEAARKAQETSFLIDEEEEQVEHGLTTPEVRSLRKKHRMPLGSLEEAVEDREEGYFINLLFFSFCYFFLFLVCLIGECFSMGLFLKKRSHASKLPLLPNPPSPPPTPPPPNSNALF